MKVAPSLRSSPRLAWPHAFLSLHIRASAGAESRYLWLVRNPGSCSGSLCTPSIEQYEAKWSQLPVPEGVLFGINVTCCIYFNTFFKKAYPSMDLDSSVPLGFVNVTEH